MLVCFVASFLIQFSFNIVGLPNLNLLSFFICNIFVDVTRGAFYWKKLMHNYQSLVVRESKNIIKAIYQIRENDTDCDLCFSLIGINDDTLILIENNNRICLQLFKSKNYYRMFYPKDLISIEEYQNIRNNRLKIT